MQIVLEDATLSWG